MNASPWPARAGRQAGRLWVRLSQVKLPSGALTSGPAPARPPGSLAAATRKATRHLFGTVAALFRQLALQVTGCIFLVFAFTFGYEGFRGWRRLPEHSHAQLPYLEMGIGLLLAYFGISSFFRAHSRR